MKLAVLGGTGLTGKPLILQALEAGHEVVAIVRSPSKLADIQHDSLTVVTANIFSADDLKKHFLGADAVLSTLGFPSICPRTCTYVKGFPYVFNPILVGLFVPYFVQRGAKMPPSVNEPKNLIWKKFGIPLGVTVFFRKQGSCSQSFSTFSRIS